MFWVRTPTIVQQLFPRVVWKGNEDFSLLPSCTLLGKKVYLTFDDGPHPEITPWVLSILAQHNTKATFFCLGERIEQYPTVFEQIKIAGHTIGNHGYQHFNGWKISRKEYLKNYEKGKLISGSTLFRPPYAKFRALRKFNHQELIICSVLPHDYHPKVSGEQCFQNIKNHLQDNDIIVLHDNEKAYSKLQYVLPRLFES